MYKLLLALSIFFPLLFGQSPRYKVEIEGARVISATTVVWGRKQSCANIGGEIYGWIYYPESALVLWVDSECEDEIENFYITTGVYWIKKVCSIDDLNNCIIPTSE